MNERKKYDRLRAKQIVVTTASGQFIVNTSEEGWREDFAKASANPSPGDTIAMIDGNNAITSGLKAGISGWEPVELSHKDDRGDRKLTRRRQRVQTAHHSEAAAMYPDWAKHPHSARVIGVSPGSYSTIVASEPWLRR